MAKHLFDPDEAEDLANNDVEPTARLLYMLLRVGFGLPDCGFGKIAVRQMADLSGLGRSIIVEALIPELVLHGYIVYDNNLIFIKNMSKTEGLTGKLKQRFMRDAFIKSLSEYQNVSSLHGGRNRALIAAIKFFESDIQMIISDYYFPDKRELSELNSISEPTPDQKKRRAALAESVALCELCKAITETIQRNFAGFGEKSPINDSGMPKTDTPYTPPIHPLYTTYTKSVHLLDTTSIPHREPIMGMGMGEDKEFPNLSIEERGVGKIFDKKPPDKPPDITEYKLPIDSILIT